MSQTNDESLISMLCASMIEIRTLLRDCQDEPGEADIEECLDVIDATFEESDLQSYLEELGEFAMDPLVGYDEGIDPDMPPLEEDFSEDV